MLAHVPDINDFVQGFAILLKAEGVSTFEFPHLVRLMENAQFDTIYHEHFSYLSLSAVKRIFEANGLSVFDVEEISTHGGSLRVYAQRSDTGMRPVEPRVGALLGSEQVACVTTKAFYGNLQGEAETIARDLLDFLITAGKENKRVGSYGAAAKGNTLMNFAGIKPHLMPWVVDLNPAKQGKFLPGSRIPIVAEDCLRTERPDYVVIWPWNIREEVEVQLDYIREWGGQFVTAVPRLTVR